MATQTLITGAQFDRLPDEDGRRWELLDGELIEMASATARHNRVLSNLLTSLQDFCERTSFGIVLPDTEFAFGSNRRFRPDLAIVDLPTWQDVDLDRVPILQVPLVAIEIVSPSESWGAVERKVQAYLEAGVQAVLLLDPQIEKIYVHTRGGVKPYLAGDILTLEVLPGWSMPLRDLFAYSKQ